MFARVQVSTRICSNILRYNRIISQIYGHRNYSFDDSAATNSLCWKCKRPSIGLFCVSCNVIQPIRAPDYFSYLGLERIWSINEPELKQRFRKLQSQVHPDKFGQSSQREKELSEKHSSYLNNAYRTLRDPFRRASYLLGVRVGDEENSGKATDSQLAMDMMELHEEIDDLSDAKELELKLAEVQGELDRLFSRLGQYLEKGNTEEARKILDRIRFFITAKRSICGKLGRYTD
ncbi:dnaJ domain-containing protein [Ditylenchus destructor]|nr:dnaJ domain-containing protein [Ditylenchus destructor]